MSVLFTADEITALQEALFDTTVDVYDADGTALVRAGLRAHWMGINLTGQGAGDRAALLNQRELRFDPAYALSDYAQVADHRGGRWNVAAGTVGIMEPGDVPIYGRADVVRAS